ncbi:transaldolase [Candidatus Pelagibacter sp.]|jgi:transaldolase|nr:transaldolase [Candidatus Pelagibacter sp.]|tara:strand:+ start:1246 stop:1974 length:729 start_codon:yes stop_codon:yes gene_type:complete
MKKLKDLDIKIFADGADLASIENLNMNQDISGFTTNPSLMKKAGITDYKKFCQDVLKITKDKPISFEIFSDDLDEMYDQANEIASWGKSIFVKIPITNSKGEKTSGLIKKLLENKIKCNVTAILTIQQVKEIYEISNSETDMIISIFAGRIADTGIDPIPMMSKAVNICKTKKNIEILWASTRELINIFQANQINCQIITVPHDILKKISLIGKNLEDLSLETVQMFLTDATKAGYKIKINK